MAISKKGMTDMARSMNEAKPTIAIGMAPRSEYGYGTSITLDAEALKKLGIKKLPEVDDEYHIVAIGKVQSVSKDANQTRLQIQLTHMDLTHEDAAEEAKETPAEEKREVFGKQGVRFK